MSNDATLSHYVIEGDFTQDLTSKQQIMSIQTVIENVSFENVLELLLPSDEMDQFVLSHCKKSSGDILSPLLDLFTKASVFSIDLLTEKLVGLIDQKQLCSKLSNLTICNEFLRRVDILKRTNASGQDVSIYNAVVMSYQQIHCRGHQNVSCNVVAKTSNNNTLQNKKTERELF